jgi:hypothetical protein
VRRCERMGGGHADVCGREAVRARRRCRREWVKLCEGQCYLEWPRGKTEPNLQLSLFLLQIVKIEKDNRIRTTAYSVLFSLQTWS